MNVSSRLPLGAAEPPVPLRLLERPRAPSLPRPVPTAEGWARRWLLRWRRSR